ncbi:MAG TPA: DUF6152 family protein [Vicinamibacterales bacterium]|jgi:hypothetical protein|nr:DUF6152 family protein [Vicinamibacterales bacterium]
MTNRRPRLAHVAAVLGLCLALAPAAWAHHSQSEYDLKAKVEVEGAVTKVEWRSPHAWIYVDVTSDNGDKMNWSFELPSPVTLMRRGWTRDSVKPRDRVKVTGAPAKNFPTIAIANFIRDDSGKPLFTGTTQIYEPEAPSK